MSVSQSQGPVVAPLGDVRPDTVASYSETDRCVNAQQWPKNNREEPAAPYVCLSVSQSQRGDVAADFRNRLFNKLNITK